MTSNVPWAAIWSGVIAGFSYITAGTMLADIVDKRTAAFLVLMTGGLQSGTAAYQTARKAAITQRSDSP